MNRISHLSLIFLIWSFSVDLQFFVMAQATTFLQHQSMQSFKKELTKSPYNRERRLWENLAEGSCFEVETAKKCAQPPQNEVRKSHAAVLPGGTTSIAQLLLWLDIDIWDILLSETGKCGLISLAWWERGDFFFVMGQHPSTGLCLVANIYDNNIKQGT